MALAVGCLVRDLRFYRDNNALFELVAEKRCQQRRAVKVASAIMIGEKTFVHSFGKIICSPAFLASIANEGISRIIAPRSSWRLNMESEQTARRTGLVSVADNMFELAGLLLARLQLLKTRELIECNE